jgi:diacylglycerol kinase (ATP)
MRTALICNPASGRGRGARLIPEARAAFASVGITDVRITECAGDEARLTRAALDDGCNTIAVLGGDGTWGKCAAALAACGGEARLAFLRGGTGNDFAKNFPAPAGDYMAMAQLVAHGGTEWRVDMGRVESGSNADSADWFLNIAGFGFDVTVMERVVRGKKLSGPLVYVYSALRELFAYRGFTVTSPHVGSDATQLMIVIANGQHFGGVFHIAPNALVTDGRLDAIVVKNMGALARLPLFAAVVRGTHLSHATVQAAQSGEFTMQFAAPPTFEVDGELRTAKSPEIRVVCVPGAVRVLGGPGA